MYEIAIVGGNGKGRRQFKTFEAAEQAAHKILKEFEKDNTRSAHPVIIYGPEFSDDGWTIR